MKLAISTQVIGEFEECASFWLFSEAKKHLQNLFINKFPGIKKSWKNFTEQNQKFNQSYVIAVLQIRMPTEKGHHLD